MNKKVITYLLVSILMPVVVGGILYYFIEPIHNNLSYTMIGISLLLIIFFIDMLILEYKDKMLKYYIGYILLAIFDILYIIFMVFAYDNYLYSLIGLVGCNLLPVLINKIPMLYCLLGVVTYPSMLYTFDASYIFFILYGVLVLSILLFSVYMKFRKTTIYLNDNY
ncbi:MAG: hypothetical protein ACI35W_07560 [Anaeroplasmataceae bacterium]